MFKYIILLCLTSCILTIDCDQCKQELLDTLKNTDSVLFKCLDSDFSENFVGTIFGNCLFTYGINSEKVKQWVKCVSSNCWDQWINFKPDYIKY